MWRDCAQAIKVLNMIKVYGKPIRVNKASQDKRTQDVGANLFIGNLDPEVDEKVFSPAPQPEPATTTPVCRTSSPAIPKVEDSSEANRLFWCACSSCTTRSALSASLHKHRRSCAIQRQVSREALAL